MLLDGRLCDDEIGRDLPGRGRRHEGVVRQRGAAQGGQHVEFPPGQVRYGGTAQFSLGGEILAGQPADPAPRRAERHHVAVLQDPASHRAAVHPGPVA